MVTLNVSVTTDYSGQILSGIERIDFINLGRTNVTATFAASQFASGQILSTVFIDGSTGINHLRINGSFLNASTWGFLNWGASDRVTFTGTANADQITGSLADDWIEGRAGDDWLFSQSGVDSIFGGDGNDTISATTGLLDGGAGIDVATFFLQFAAGPVVVDLAGGGGSRDLGNGLHLNAVEIVAGAMTAFDDVLKGGNRGDSVSGSEGADLLDGRGGNDRLYGGDGADTLLGGLGNDDLDGDFGDDVIRGGAGNDRIGGGQGRDVLFGDDGADVIYGNRGFADRGGDRMTGGAGADRFIFDLRTDLVAGEVALWDVVTDFQQGLDMIDLSRLPETGALRFIGQTAFVRTYELRWYQDATDTFIETFLAGGSNDNDVKIKLLGLHSLTAADFIL